MDYLFFGIQGSGKGTQTKLIGQKFNIPVFETGHELRKIAEESTPLGQEVKATIESGHLVSNDVIMQIVEVFLERNKEAKHLIFDGIPRNTEQQNLLHSLLNAAGREFQAVLIKLSEQEAVTRLTKRAEIENRKDDTAEGIQKRISIFYEHTEPLLAFYRKNHNLVEIDGDKTVEEVYTELTNKLEL